MATEEQRRERRSAEQRESQETRRAAALSVGHPEWVSLPEFRDHARAARAELFFRGKRLGCGHVSPQFTRTGECLACFEMRGRTDADRLSDAFNEARACIEETGCLHWVDRDGRVVSTTRSVGVLPGLYDAMDKAAGRTLAEGVAWIAVPGSRSWVVKRLIRRR